MTVRGSFDYPVRDSITVRGSIDITGKKSLDETVRASTDTRLEFKRSSMASDEKGEIIEKEVDESGQATPVQEFLVSFEGGEREDPKVSQSENRSKEPVLTS